MRRIIALASIATALVSAHAVQAQTTNAANPAMYGVQYRPAETPPAGVIANRSSARLSHNFGVESEVAPNRNNADFSGMAATGNREPQAAVYGVGMLPVGSSTDLMARVGYGSSRLRVGALGAQMVREEDSWNFGVGAQKRKADGGGIRADFTRERYWNQKTGANILSFGYNKQF